MNLAASTLLLNSTGTSGLMDFAQAETKPAESVHTEATTGTTATTETPKAAEGTAPAEKPSVFVELLEHLADSHEVHLPFFHLPLPYLFWDGDGFHAFSGESSLEANANYELGHHGKAVRKDGKPIGFDMSITTNVFFMAVSAIVIFLLVRSAASKAKKTMVPSGLRNVIEVFVIFIRDEVVYPSCDPKYGEPLLPFFLSIFFFILVMNLIGLVPYGHAATGSVSVTVALAICTFVVTQIVGVKAMGLKNFAKHLTGGLVDMDIPIGIKIPLILIMIPIEIMGLFTKPFALAVRLFANMTAGHIVIVSLIGLAFLFKSLLVGTFVSVPFALFINLLELLVAFLQAYIFTMLSALFIGMMAHSEHEEHAAEEGHAHA